MVGENFIRHNRHDEHLEEMVIRLSHLRHAWGDEYHRQDEDGNYVCNLNNLESIRKKIESLKYDLYIYVANRNSIEYTREFERKYLW